MWNIKYIKLTLGRTGKRRRGGGEGGGGGGRGGPLETSELLRKWIFGYICIFDMFPLLKEGFNNCPKDVWPPLYFFSAEYSYFEISGKIYLL